MPDTQTLTNEQVKDLAESLRYTRYLNFTNLANKRAVQKEAKRLGIKTFSRTAHGSLLDPRYTVEGSVARLPDKGLGNDYKHFHPKLYCLETLQVSP